MREAPRGLALRRDAMTIRIAEARWPTIARRSKRCSANTVARSPKTSASRIVDDELAGLPGKYARPGGVVLIALGWRRSRRRDRVPHVRAGVCEMKRLYVRPAFRGAASRASLRTS
jgi:hypothetical protein